MKQQKNYQRIRANATKNLAKPYQYMKNTPSAKDTLTLEGISSTLINRYGLPKKSLAARSIVGYAKSQYDATATVPTLEEVNKVARVYGRQHYRALNLEETLSRSSLRLREAQLVLGHESLSMTYGVIRKRFTNQDLTERIKQLKTANTQVEQSIKEIRVPAMTLKQSMPVAKLISELYEFVHVGAMDSEGGHDSINENTADILD